MYNLLLDEKVLASFQKLLRNLKADIQLTTFITSLQTGTTAYNYNTVSITDLHREGRTEF
jgi:hypothetical protein